MGGSCGGSSSKLADLRNADFMVVEPPHAGEKYGEKYGHNTWEYI